MVVSTGAPHSARGAGRSRRSGLWRTLGGLITAVTSVGTAAAFLFVAYILATFNCEDGCQTGSPWAPGASGAVIELWVLALPAFLAACALAWAVYTGRQVAAALSWAATTGLLIGWCEFTGASAVTIDFSATNSHWMWLVGLLVASGGGLIGVAVSRIEPRT